MNFSPVIRNEYKSAASRIKVDLTLDQNLCLVIGDSGIGKSFLWEIFDRDRAEERNLLTFNYKDINSNVEEIISRHANLKIVMLLKFMI